MSKFDKTKRVAWRDELLAELTTNILPFWIEHMVDRENGGFYGALTNDLLVIDKVPHAAVLCARILWSYSAAYRRLKKEEYLAMARWAYDYLKTTFWDKDYGGLYWQVDREGRPLIDRKQYYAQAFGLYGLAEYHRATGNPEALALAKELGALLMEHGYDAEEGGYFEAATRDWRNMEQARLGATEPLCRKSMNTMLHILEAFTNLLRVWDDPRLKKRHRELILTFLAHVIDPAAHHFRLFFAQGWQPLSANVSYGHDIEGSWLLVEAAEVQQDEGLLAQVEETAVAMAEAVYREGRDEDGSLFYEAGPTGLVDDGKAWWVQAEAMVGFYNVHRISGREDFAAAAYRCWEYCREKLVDRRHGEWFKRLFRDGTPDHRVYKAGPWECPYHHTRACLEMLHRLEREDGS